MWNELEPNRPIELAKTYLVEVDGERVEVPVNVVFPLNPTPRVVIESERLPNIVLQNERFRITLRNGAQLEAMVGSFNFGTAKGSLTPSRLPVDVIDKALPLTSVQFGILNFPELYGRQGRFIDHEQYSILIPHSKLDVPNWCVEITGVRNIADVVKTLKQNRGYGFTYKGFIKRSDGSQFMPSDVAKLLEALRLFFSFVRGGYCSLAMIEGMDQVGRQSWVRWGAHKVSAWDNRHSWIDKHNGTDILSELFPKFVSALDGGDSGASTVSRSIDLYLSSNDLPPYIGLVLTQASLERMCHQILGRSRKKNEPTGIYIEKGLEELKLDSRLPPNCKELLRLGKWDSGPHALVDVRNDLVHPREKLGVVSNLAHHESWHLGQWYIEMILLNRLGFQGRYVNRLAGWGEADQAIRPVPWAEAGQQT